MPQRSPQRVHEPYVAIALLAALTAGFGLAAFLVAALALTVPLGPWWTASVQAHGHAQLFGWAGLFVLGVGLYFVPRLRGVILARAELAPVALVFFTAGIGLRSLSQVLLGLLADRSQASSLLGSWMRAGLALSGLLIVVGVVPVAVMLFSTFRGRRPLSPEAPIVPVFGYLATAFISLVLATLLNAVLSLEAVIRGGYLLPSDWDEALTHLLIMGFILPVAVSLSVRNLPLFLRLAFPPRQQLSPLLAVYLVGLVARLAGTLERPFGLGSVLAIRLGSIGEILQGGAFLAFVWMIDIPLRRKPPWTASRLPTPPEVAASRRPTRRGYPDYGEYGRFELLVISAFIWLAVSGLVAIVNGVFALVAAGPLWNPDIERHALTVGFITLLIFGMAVRMLPGFSGKTRIASTGLVLATFWLGNLAALFRVVPLFARNVPGANVVLGISGIIGWLAVACLAINLWRTKRL